MSSETVNDTSATVFSTTLMPVTSPTRTPAMRTSSPSSRLVTSAKRARYPVPGPESAPSVWASAAVMSTVTTAKMISFVSGAAIPRFIRRPPSR